MTVGIARPLGGGSGSAVSVSGIWKRGADTLAIGNSIGEGAFGLSTPSGVSWCAISAPVTLDAIAHPSYRDRRADHQIQLKCVQAGTIGTEEPEWPAVGQEIADGTARWVVERCTQAMNQNPGYFHIAQELVGQPLRLIYTVGGPGRRSEFVIEHARRALTKCSPSVVFVADMFANDISQLGGSMPAYQAAWSVVQAFLDEQVAAGRLVLLQGVTPGNMFNTAPLREGCAYFHRELASWVLRNPGMSSFWDAPSKELGSLVLGANWNPDDATTYQVSSGVFDKITDGIHPQNVAHWRLAPSFADAIKALGLPPRTLQDVGGVQRWANTRNLGTAGSVGAGIVGQAPTGWNVGRDGAATATSSMEPRTDGVRGNWWVLQATSTDGGKVYAYSSMALAASGFAIGDSIEMLAEMIGADMSPTAFCPRVEIAFWNAAEYTAFASLNYAGGQQFGQAMGSENRVQLAKPIPFGLKVPPGTTDIAVTVSIEGSGAWSGALKIGRININNLSE